MTPCALTLACLALLAVCVWQWGTIRGLRREIAERDTVGRLLHEKRVEEP